MAWRYYLRSIPSGEWITKDLEVVDDEVVTVLSGPASIRATVPVEVQSLKLADGSPAILAYGCEIIAEQVGGRTTSAIVDKVTRDGESLVLEAGGFSMLPAGEPWLARNFVGVQEDPLDMVRKVFAHLGAYSNVGVVIHVDDTKSTVRVGEEKRQVSFTTSTGEKVEFETGPFLLSWWTTDDLGKVVDDLATETPFQYREHTTWVNDEPHHRLELGFPSVGARKANLRFEVGLNITATPAINDTEYASEVIVFGAGEGRKKVSSGPISVGGNRIRRVYQHTDTSIRTKSAAVAKARMIVKSMQSGDTIDTLEVVDHDSAPFGSFWEGDTIRVQGDAGWAQLDRWVVIEEISHNPSSGGMTLKVRET